MAGLLDFVAGFGVGALGGVAEQKKANLEQKRQLNLAKLKAEYATDIQTKQEENKIKTMTDLMSRYREGDVAAADELRARGVDPSQSGEDTALMKNARAAYPNNPEMQRLFIRRGGELGSDIPEIENSWKQGGYEYARLTNGSIVRLSANAPGGMIPVSGPASTAPSEQTNFVEVSPTKTTQQQDLATAKSPAPTKPVMERLDEILGEGVSNIPPEDVISLGTGPIDAAKAFGLRIPIIGDLLAASGDQSGAAQRRARTNLNYVMNRVITTYKQNDGRTSNAEMELNKLLAPEGGFFSTDSSYYNDLIGLRRNLVADIRRNANIAQDSESAVPTFSADDAASAREFLRGSYGALQTIDGYMTAYSFQNETVPVNGQRVRIRNLSQNDLLSVDPNTLSPEQYNLLTAWEQYNNWSSPQ